MPTSLNEIKKHWNRLQYKWHRDFAGAQSPAKLYQILGNQVSAETAKMIDRQEFPTLHEVAQNILWHTCRQQKAIANVYRYLIDLDGLHHSQLKIEKESQASQT